MNDTNENPTCTLVISCPDKVGIVAAVANFIAERSGSLVESNHHTDVDEGWFYLRNVITSNSLAITPEQFREEFQAVADQFEMEWHLRDNRKLQKMVIMASHASHCLADLLYRWKAGELACEIPCVISNHENLRGMVEWHGIPFHYVPVPKENKAEAFARTNEIIARHEADCVVLARYMQIIPPELCERYVGRLINIHHSFLPSFIGANPYQKAFDRGVKLVGATSHYVTQDLDEGPIIDQDVIRVSHSCNRDDMVRLGRDVEKAVLARGVRYHLEDRVIVRGNKTIVF
ncbi:MAG: formyltetrahydrofolate deformylase [Halioglobus sp.]